MKIPWMAIYILFISINCFAGELVKIHIHGGGPDIYVDDVLSVTENGDANLKSISPFPSNAQPFSQTIGNFKGQLSRKQLSQLVKQAESHSKSVQQKSPPLPDTMTIDLTLKRKAGVTTHTQTLVTSKGLGKFYLELKKKTRWKPASSLKLTCTSSPKPPITCQITNIGTEPISTIDPLLASNSLFCADKTKLRTPLNQLEENDPKKMRPKVIKLQSKESYSFVLNSAAICDGQVIMKTSDMLINDDYKNLLLGEMWSNTIVVQ